MISTRVEPSIPGRASHRIQHRVLLHVQIRQRASQLRKASFLGPAGRVVDLPNSPAPDQLHLDPDRRSSLSQLSLSQDLCLLQPYRSLGRFHKLLPPLALITVAQTRHHLCALLLRLHQDLHKHHLHPPNQPIEPFMTLPERVQICSASKRTKPS